MKREDGKVAPSRRRTREDGQVERSRGQVEL